MEASVNVLGGPLDECSADPATGFFRNGCCDTSDEDRGSHTVCAVMTAEFLAYSKYVGNDLSTPHPEFQFPGLKPGDSWCLLPLRGAVPAGPRGGVRAEGEPPGHPPAGAGDRAALGAEGTRRGVTLPQ